MGSERPAGREHLAGSDRMADRGPSEGIARLDHHPTRTATSGEPSWFAAAGTPNGIRTRVATLRGR